MNTLANRWSPGEVRLWGSSALGALLLHLTPAALLVFYLHWTPRLPPQAGSHSELDVDLASMPQATPSAVSSAQAPSQLPTRQTPATQLTVNLVRPLGEMQPIPQQLNAASSNAPPVAAVGAASAPGGMPDLGSAAAGMAVQLWVEEVRARLKSHMVYPGSAIQKMQQQGVMKDTVKLQFAVDKAGQVTYSRVQSEHHYEDLEQEAQQMLRLSSALPAPPPQVLATQTDVIVPVEFDLSLSPSAKDTHNKPLAMPPPRPTLNSCRPAASPGPAPAGSAATLEQMNAYRDHLKQYVAAAGNQLTCLSQVADVSAPGMRDALARQLHSMVDDFNTQARIFETQAQVRAQQAQQARERDAQALAAQLYGPCTAPTALKAPRVLSAQDGVSFRKQLVTYQSAVRSYVTCLQKAEQSAMDPARGLANDQQALLQQSAAQLGNAAIASFNQLVARFNAQVPQLRKTITAEEQLAEAVVQGAAIFPTSSWNLPVPLPPDECVYITQLGQRYEAHLCIPSYGTSVSDLSQQLRNNVDTNAQYLSAAELTTKHMVDGAADNALPAADMQVEAIAAQHGFPTDSGGTCATTVCAPPILGIAVTTQAGFGQMTQSAATSSQTITYSVSELQVAGRRLSMTISRRSNQSTASEAAGAVHLDLVLSADKQTLRGYCWTDQQRSPCTLTRHGAGFRPGNSPR